MQVYKLLIIIFLCSVGCKNKNQPLLQEKFDELKWKAKNDRKYLYRNGMLADLIANYQLKGMRKEEVLSMLGQPNRSDNGHYFYTVNQEFFGNTTWPIHTKTLVIKLTKDSIVEWRKIHE